MAKAAKKPAKAATKKRAGKGAKPKLTKKPPSTTGATPEVLDRLHDRCPWIATQGPSPPRND